MKIYGLMEDVTKTCDLWKNSPGQLLIILSINGKFNRIVKLIQLFLRKVKK